MAPLLQAANARAAALAQLVVGGSQTATAEGLVRGSAFACDFGRMLSVEACRLLLGFLAQLVFGGSQAITAEGMVHGIFPGSRTLPIIGSPHLLAACSDMQDYRGHSTGQWHEVGCIEIRQDGMRCS